MKIGKAMPYADLPPQIQERVICSISAAVKYEIPVNIVLAVAEKEAGKPGQWVQNSNGTYDVGPMQFNTKYMHDLARYGIKPSDVATSGCYSFDLAAWRLRGHIKNDKGDLWTRVANYHSRTPKYNVVYRADLRLKAAKWADWVAARFVTVEVTKTRGVPSPSQQLNLVEMTNALTVSSAKSATPETATKNTSGYVPRKLIINGQP
jgi:hypothetical protein